MAVTSYKGFCQRPALQIMKNASNNVLLFVCKLEIYIQILMGLDCGLVLIT